MTSKLATNIKFMLLVLVSEITLTTTNIVCIVDAYTEWHAHNSQMVNSSKAFHHGIEGIQPQQESNNDKLEFGLTEILFYSGAYFICAHNAIAWK